MNRIWTLLDAHRSLTEFLSRHGVEEPRLASEIVTAHALGMKRIDIYTKFDQPLTAEELDAVRKLGKRLAAGEALQLVVGDAQFFSYFFAVRQGVFIPRPETETLVDTAARFMKNRGEDAAPPTLLDLCTGSGVIAVTMLKFLPYATAVATEISPAAVDLARENAEKLGVTDRIEVLEGNLFEPLAPGAVFDAITANPPYIPTHDILRVEPVVKDNDPNAALDGGSDGLDVIRRIAAGAPARLAPGGFIALEVGAGQAGDVETILKGEGFARTEMRRDLSGIERVVTGWME